MLARRIRPVLIAVLLAATGMLLLACSSDDRAPEGTATVEQGELSGAESTTSPTPIATVTPPLTPPPSSAELAANAVVRVDVLIAGSVVANGSGTAIGDGRHVLTNHHVVDAGNAYEVVLEGMGGVTTTAPAEVVLFNETMDLAMLRLPSSLGVPLELAEEAPASGQSVLIAGYPDIGGSTLTVTRGTVSGFNDFGDGLGRVWIKTDATISFGNSGGAAIDDAGRLVGVPTGVMSDGVGGIGYLLGSTAAADFVAAGLVSDGLPAPQRPVVTGDPFEFCALVDTADLRFSNHGDVQYVGLFPRRFPVPLRNRR